MAEFSRITRRPRVLAGGSLGVAGVATGLVLALGGTAATAPAAFAVTQQSNGTVQVQLKYGTEDLAQVNAKLAAMGTGEAVTIYGANGPAATPGAVTCKPAPGVTGPTIKVLEGDNGTETIAPGESAGNTAEGTFHLASCTASNIGSGNSGNSGAA